MSGNAIEILNEQKAQLEQLKLNLCQEEIEQILESDVFQQWENRFQEHIADMKQNGSDLAKLWFTYLELYELLLALINATRTGNSELYLACIENVIPWTFSYDRQNYARYLVQYLNDIRVLCLQSCPRSTMSSLPDTSAYRRAKVIRLCFIRILTKFILNYRCKYYDFRALIYSATMSSGITQGINQHFLFSNSDYFFFI